MNYAISQEEYWFNDHLFTVRTIDCETDSPIIKEIDLSSLPLVGDKRILSIPGVDDVIVPYGARIVYKRYPLYENKPKIKEPKMKNGDTPAMPFEGGENNGEESFSGMTKREMIAMHLHAALLSASDSEGTWTGNDNNAADIAVIEADMLLKALESEETQ